ncbi:hypothetical protein CPC08DRAFT_761804 [Agrocybe pediades]|nr:hypothetical protein CPC08DRAFT_761804 [Agrocybe pediades]
MADGVTDSQQGSALNGTSVISQRKYLPPGKCDECDDPINEKKRKIVQTMASLPAFSIRCFGQSPNAEPERTTLYEGQPCLEDILDLFSERDSDGNFKLEGGSAVKTKAYCAIMEELASCVATADEQSRYEYFVKVSNMAFEILSSMKTQNSKPAPTFDRENAVMFMVNHPTRMYSVYKGETYCQSPSILLGYKKDIQEVYPQASLDPVPLSLTAPPRSYAARVLTERQSVLRDSESGSRGSSSTQDGDSPLEEADIVKRPADYTSDQRPSKKRKTDSDVTQDREIPCNITGDVTDEIRKLADIAAEAMCNCYGRDHVLGFVLTGSTLNVWIFDHEGPIQLMGFDFIQDFPYFLLLLYVLQRFTPEDFGFLPVLGFLRMG